MVHAHLKAEPNALPRVRLPMTRYDLKLFDEFRLPLLYPFQYF